MRLVIEKRQHARKKVNLPATLTLASGERGEGVCVDMSLGGAFVETSLVPKFGDSVSLTLAIPGADGVSVLPGIIRWTTPSGSGVQFGLLGARETHAIVSFLAKV